MLAPRSLTIWRCFVYVCNYMYMPCVWCKYHMFRIRMYHKTHQNSFKVRNIQPHTRQHEKHRHSHQTTPRRKRSKSPKGSLSTCPSVDRTRSIFPLPPRWRLYRPWEGYSLPDLHDIHAQLTTKLSFLCVCVCVCVCCWILQHIRHTYKAYKAYI